MISDIEHVDNIVSHLREVHDNAIRLAKHLIGQGETDLGLKLLQRAFSHDVDKFSGIQWEYMRRGTNPTTTGLVMAVKEHNHSNPHHPEYHGDIHKMSRLDLAEMVCDWAARAAESKTSLQDFIDHNAMKRYQFKKSDAVYKTIMDFKAVIADEPFQSLNTMP